MKRFASAPVVVMVLLVVGCGSSTSSSPGSPPTTAETRSTTTGPRTAWPGPPRASADGTLEVAEFNDYAGSLDEAQEPKQLALVFLRPPQPYTITQETRPGGATVTILRDRLEDDSVHAERYELEFGLGTGGVWRLTSAKVAYKCQMGRGHQDFTAELCL